MGRRPVGSHKADPPGSSPGPATTGTWLIANGRWPEGSSLTMSHLLFAIRLPPTEYANRQSGQVESLVPVGSTPTSVSKRREAGGGRPEENRPGWLPSAFLLPPSHFLLPPPIPWSNGTTPVRHTGDDGSTPSGINHKRAHGPTARRQLGRLSIRVRLPVSPLFTHGRQPDTVGRTALLTRFFCTGDEGSNPSPSALGEVHSLQFSVLSFGVASD